jgi:hypothetical protein
MILLNVYTIIMNTKWIVSKYLFKIIILGFFFLQFSIEKISSR